ncbi:hypothetical protein [Candidatus Accumulibacter sp. ACC007]|uniref:hypothetical protein n=1 Tax=Candidatus Accumulibacter sp. ACC007 TaxID=2823333 RepID=UPI0025BF283A|nr:hypothetical protein [Candidatus Accumulibacter sp. ACC007]
MIFHQLGESRRANLAIEGFARPDDASPMFQDDLIIDRRRRLFLDQPAPGFFEARRVPLHEWPETIDDIPKGMQIGGGMRSKGIPEKDHQRFQPHARRIKCLFDVIQPVAYGLVESIELPCQYSLDAIDRFLDVCLGRSRPRALELGLHEGQPIAGAVKIQGVDTTIVAAIRYRPDRCRVIDLALAHQCVGREGARQTVKVVLPFGPVLSVNFHDLGNAGEEAVSQGGFDLGDFFVSRRHRVSSASSAAGIEAACS